MAAFLAHEACPVSGEIYAAGAGRFARMFIASTRGIRPLRPGADGGRRRRGTGPTINDEADYIPADLMAWSATFMAHLAPDGAARDT